LVSDIKGRTQTESIQNRMLRRLFGPKWNEIIGGWRKQHIGELHDLYSLLNTIGMIKSRRMRWPRHVAHMAGEEECIQNFDGKARKKKTTRKI
jgi:hypothetical protein